MSEPDKDHKAVAVVERGDVVKANPLMMLQHAVEHGMDPETIEKLMALAERHEANEARKAYDSAMISLKRDLPPVLGRDTVVDFPTSKGRVHYFHTSLAAAVAALTDTMAMHGFAHSWTAETDSGKVGVTCHISHAQGHSRTMTLSAPPDKSGSKSDAQAIASTITMLERYSLLAMLGIATADMREPQGETPPDLIDSARNMKAAKAFADLGYKREEVEAKLGKTIAEWKAKDLDVLRSWLGEVKASVRTTDKQEARPSKAGAKQEPPPQDEPPQEDWSNVGPPDWDGDQVDDGQGRARS